MWTNAYPKTYNRYTADDIIEVDITDSMMAEAKREKAYYDQFKQSEQTVNLRDDHDLIGSLAHQAVERYMATTPFTWQSTRTAQHKGGDKCDIIYGQWVIDVKHAYGVFNPQYYYNHSCPVTQKEWDNKLANSVINAFVFVNVDLDSRTAFILGAIDKEQFDSLKQPFVGKVAGYQVRSRQLQPMRQFVYGA